MVINALEINMPARTPRHRYGVGVGDYTFSIQHTTIEAFRALVPMGRRGEFVDNAIRHALAELQRKTGGVGALPGEQLETIAQALEAQAYELRQHAKTWGEP